MPSMAAPGTGREHKARSDAAPLGQRMATVIPAVASCLPTKQYLQGALWPLSLVCIVVEGARTRVSSGLPQSGAL